MHRALGPSRNFDSRNVEREEVGLTSADHVELINVSGGHGLRGILEVRLAYAADRDLSIEAWRGVRSHDLDVGRDRGDVCSGRHPQGFQLIASKCGN